MAGRESNFLASKGSTYRWCGVQGGKKLAKSINECSNIKEINV